MNQGSGSSHGLSIAPCALWKDQSFDHAIIAASSQAREGGGWDVGPTNVAGFLAYAGANAGSLGSFLVRSAGWLRWLILLVCLFAWLGYIGFMDVLLGIY